MTTQAFSAEEDSDIAFAKMALAEYERGGGTSLAELKTELATSRMEIPASDWSRDLVKQIAMDIGKETVAYVEVMYPTAIVNSGFKLSLRNHIYNEIMAAIDVTDEGKIVARLADRKRFRRWWINAYRKLRREPSRAALTKPD